MFGMRSEFLKEIDYNRKLQAQLLVNRGIADDLLYFWFNLTEGNYVHRVLAINDGEQLKRKYVSFEKDINDWLHN
jgi:hypothetical protein